MPYATDAKGPLKGYNHGSSVKNSAVYEALITKKGMSKSKAAAISNGALNKGAKKGRHHRKRKAH